MGGLEGFKVVKSRGPLLWVRITGIISYLKGTAMDGNYQSGESGANMGRV